MKPRAIVYIDGYNWYHAIFKHYPEWKWLNIQSFFEAMRPHEEIQAVKLFTAIVDEENKLSDARARHIRYISALKTLKKVKIVLGKFQGREVTCRAKCGQKYIVPEEKKTDVNIAVEIISDAVQNRCDSIILVSGDSDAQPPIQWVKNNYPSIKITVYVPALLPEADARKLNFYKQIGVDCRFFPLGDLPQPFTPASGSVWWWTGCGEASCLAKTINDFKLTRYPIDWSGNRAMAAQQSSSIKVNFVFPEGLLA